MQRTILYGNFDSLAKNSSLNSKNQVFSLKETPFGGSFFIDNSFVEIEYFPYTPFIKGELNCFSVAGVQLVSELLLLTRVRHPRHETIYLKGH